MVFFSAIFFSQRFVGIECLKCLVVEFYRLFCDAMAYLRFHESGRWTSVHPVDLIRVGSKGPRADDWWKWKSDALCMAGSSTFLA